MVSLVPGQNIFYNEMPDAPTKCLAVLSPKHSHAVPAQIDASTHYLKIIAREATSTAAYDLAAQSYQALYSETGIIVAGNLTLLVHLHGTPIWEKTDQQGRRYYYFTATAITKRLL